MTGLKSKRVRTLSSSIGIYASDTEEDGLIIALQIGQYLTNIYKKTAALWDSIFKTDYDLIVRCNDVFSKKDDHWHINKLDIYNNTSYDSQNTQRKHIQYAYNLYLNNRFSINELIKCSRKIVVINLAAWNMDKCEETMHVLSQIENYNKWTYICVRGSINDVKKFEATYHIIIDYMPYFFNPFIIKRGDFNFIEGLIIE